MSAAALTAAVLIVSVLILSQNVVAARAAPASGVITTIFDLPAALHFSARGAQLNAKIVLPVDGVWGDSGRYLLALENLRTADARSDITSVKATSTMVSGGGSDKGNDNYLEKAEAGTAVLSTDGEKTNVGQQASNGSIDGLIQRRTCEPGTALLADDFVAHTREYLQTKK